MASAPGTGGGAQGTLAGTATVVTSVGLVIGPDGEKRMIIANAADPADNVSSLQMVKLTPVADKVSKPRNAKKHHQGIPRQLIRK